VGTGQVDAFLLTGGGPWDLAALVPIVEEAGGRFSDVAGGHALDRVVAVFTNGVLHEQVLRCLQRDPYSGNEVNRR
jgi:histidinol-phosphatase